MTLPLQPKAIHDEMNATTFDEYGRMQANIGVEAQPPSPGAQNVTLYPFVNPATELINGTNLPTPTITYDASGLPVSEIKITPITNASDGTQIWRITHNGVDTHPIHFHLYDVQVVNRVTWDNIIIPAEMFERERLKITNEPFLLVTGLVQQRHGTIHVKARQMERLDYPGLTPG